MAIVGYRVAVEQKIRLPKRDVDEVIERVFTVRVKTPSGAKSAVKSAGIKGDIVRCEPIRG